jgi:hypothetical protein
LALKLAKRANISKNAFFAKIWYGYHKTQKSNAESKSVEKKNEKKFTPNEVIG